MGDSDPFDGLLPACRSRMRQLICRYEKFAHSQRLLPAEIDEFESRDSSAIGAWSGSATCIQVADGCRNEQRRAVKAQVAESCNGDRMTLDFKMSSMNRHCMAFPTNSRVVYARDMPSGPTEQD
jgi:hypothetical protein